MRPDDARPTRPALCRRRDFELGMAIDALLKARGVEALAYRAAEGDRATKGRWKGFVVEYSRFDLSATRARRWHDVRLVVEAGVAAWAAYGPSVRPEPTYGPMDTPERAAGVVVAVLDEPHPAAR